MRYSPAEWAIRVFGDARAVAIAAGVATSQPWRWLSTGKVRTSKYGPRSRSAGDIPIPACRMLLAVAMIRGLDLTERDLLIGREVSEELAPAS